MRKKADDFSDLTLFWKDEIRIFLPCHSEIVRRQKPSKLNKDVIKRSTESTPLCIIQQQDILESEMEKSLSTYWR